MRRSPWVLAAASALVCAQWDDNRLRPFVVDHRAAAASPADVSFLLDAPAGKDGFIRIKDGHFHRPDGRRIRFWGVHFTDWSKGSVMLPPKEDAPMWTATLARHGINCVRLHFLDLFAPRGIIDSAREDSRAFDAQQLDRLDFLVAELKKRGIYVDLNLNVGRSYKAGDGVQDAGKIRWGKGLVLFDPRLIELQKEYARQILTHVNPYTKTEYRNEPAVAIVEILNENGLYLGFRAPTPYYDELLTSQYNAWLKKRLSEAELKALRAMAGVEGVGAVPRLSAKEASSAPRDRYAREMAFYRETENNFYQDMAGYLRKLGVKAPITGTADHSHSSSPYPMLATLVKLDIVDGHVYWQHPGARGPANTPMVNDPFNSTVVQLSRTAFAGKPYTVSEVNHPFPNDWASEGIPILAAYGCLQDWDGIFLYTFEPKLDPKWQPYVGDPFDISLDPVRMTQMAAGALIFLRGDVRGAARTVERSYSADQVLESRRLPQSEAPYFTPGFPLALPLMHKVRISSFDGPPTGRYEAPAPGPVVSDTRELTWDPAEMQGVVRVDTERTQALIGFVGGERRSVTHLTAELRTRFASLVLTSLDGQPIAKARRMLLSAGSRVANSGSQWNETRTWLSQYGGAPTLIEPVSGTVHLSGLDRSTAVNLQPLDGSGRPLGAPIHGKKTEAGWVLPIGEPVTTWYIVSVERR